MTAERARIIQDRITAALEPVEIEVIDESHKHIGHAGARDGRGHFRLRIISSRFQGQHKIARHRLIYAALGDLMQSDIHALSIEAYAPGEV